MATPYKANSPAHALITSCEAIFGGCCTISTVQPKAPLSTLSLYDSTTAATSSQVDFSEHRCYLPWLEEKRGDDRG
jgi:hypothetical protein